MNTDYVNERKEEMVATEEQREKLEYSPPVLDKHEGWVDVIGASI